MGGHRSGFLALAVAIVSGAAWAAEPPDVLNYQGVLRNASDQPLTGTYDMTFRFYDDDIAGNEVLVDRHTAAAGGAVAVSGGLFNVLLGNGSVSDGSGPGFYTTLSQVFRDHTLVMMSIQVGAETLTPRVGIASAAYALNAKNLAGRSASEFLDTSASWQQKNGKLTLVNYGSFYALDARSDYGAAYFQNDSSGEFAILAANSDGIRAYGPSAGGRFWQLGTSASAELASGGWGVIGQGSVGGYFADTSGSGYAYLAFSGLGVEGLGTSYGGYFADLDGTGTASLGFGNRGIEAYGTEMAGYFLNTGAGGGRAQLGWGDVGILASGTQWGGWFNTAKVDGRTQTGTLEIVGGADLSEPFPLDGDLAEGTVVVIDATGTGSLTASTHPYDTRVAGIVAGAGGIRPGIVMSRGPAGADEAPVALSGRVWCLAGDESGPIRPGDLLTTSSLPGHAMRATDPARTPGAVLGKAMSALDSGRGLVLVLVSLQ